MSQRVISHLSKLEKLSKAKPRKRRDLLQKASLLFIKTIVECIENVMTGNIQLKSECKEKLRKYKAILRKIYNSENKLRAKKEIIVQNGGAFLPALLVPVVSILAEKLLRKI